MSVLAVVLLAVGLAGAILRPARLPVWVLPVIAAAIAVVGGIVDGSAPARRTCVRSRRRLAFVLVAVPLAASLDQVGVFDELAGFAARSRHVVGALWILAFLVVALLNLDAAVVLLTPLYTRTAVLVDVDPIALVFQPVLLASLASGVLAVSNLTNLLAASRLSLHEPGLPRPSRDAVAGRVDGRVVRVSARVSGARARARGTAPRRSARARHRARDDRALSRAPARRRAVRPSRVGGRARSRSRAGRGRRGGSRWRHVPVGTVVLAAALAVLAAGVASELPHAFTSLGAGGFEGFGAGVVSANVLNNLPAVLVGLTHVSVQSHVWPLLLGVNLGPLLLLTGRSPACCGRRAHAGPGSRSTPCSTRGSGRPSACRRCSRPCCVLRLTT